MATPDLTLAPPATIIPLSRLVLCPNCENASDATGDACPACGHSNGLINLSTVLSERANPTMPTEGAENHGNSNA